MSDVRIGIIGLGGMGSSHARYLTAGEVPNAKLTAVCDISGARLDFARETYGDAVKCYDNAQDLIDSGDVDGVLIATPHYDHPPIAIKALEAGLHVLSEKPAGVYTKQVREMNEAAEKSDKVFGIMYNQRTSGLYQKMRELIQDGELGEIQRTSWLITNWFRSQSYYDSGGWRASWRGEGGGVLLNQCPHNLDLWQWICGMPTKVHAFCHFGRWHNIEVEDDVTAYVEYANGGTGVFITTTADAPGTNRLEVTGDRGKLVVENGKLTFHRTRVSVGDFRMNFKGGFGSPECWDIEIPVREPGGSQHCNLTKNWVQSIVTGSPLLAPGEEGINGLTLSNAMILSAWTGETISLPIDEERYLAELNKRIETSSYQKDATGKTLDTEGSYG